MKMTDDLRKKQSTQDQWPDSGVRATCTTHRYVASTLPLQYYSAVTFGYSTLMTNSTETDTLGYLTVPAVIKQATRNNPKLEAEIWLIAQGLSL